LSPEYQVPEADDPGPNASNAYDIDGVAESLTTLGFATWRPTSDSRKMEFLARHRDGTIVRIHRNKRLTVEFDYSNCDRFKNNALPPKPVAVELRRSKNWRWTICYWAIWCRANCRWAICIGYFRVVGNVRYAIKQFKSRYKTPNRVVRLKPIYTEPPTNEFEWRGWGL
jgi:hypothetical protein